MTCGCATKDFMLSDSQTLTAGLVDTVTTFNTSQISFVSTGSSSVQSAIK